MARGKRITLSLLPKLVRESEGDVVNDAATAMNGTDVMNDVKNGLDGSQKSRDMLNAVDDVFM